MAKNNQVAKVTELEAEAPTEAREAPTLKPAAVTVQSEGYCWREFLVRLPAEAILQDLGVPSIWKVIQSNPQKSLRALDRVTVVAHDESFVARDLLVTEAGPHHAVLAIRPADVIRMQAKSATWQDDRHVVKWAGSGFGIFRRSDDVQLVPQTFASIDAARVTLVKEFMTTSGVRR